MEEQAQNPVNAGDTTYGKNPPNAPFKNVISYLDDLIKIGGAKGTFDDLTKAVKSGSINSSTFRIRVAIMKKYNLIRTDKNTYTIQPLGIMIAAPVNEEQRKEAVRKAALNIDIVRKIWDAFKGNIMPPKSSLVHNLATRFPNDIPNDLAKAWADYFYDAMDVAGFIDQRINGNYLISSEPNPEKFSGGGGATRDQSEGDVITTPEVKERKEQLILPPSNDTNITNSKTLTSGKLIAFSAPEEPTREEALEIEKFLRNQLKRNKGFTENDNGQ